MDTVSSLGWRSGGCTALAELQGLLPYLEDRQDLIEENAYLRGLSCIENNGGQSIEDWLNNQQGSQPPPGDESSGSKRKSVETGSRAAPEM
jgi:hypothetical protein